MKKMLLGFMIGVIVASSFMVFATGTDIFTAEKATFSVVVNGVLFEGEKPVVAIDGSTYLSLTDTGKALNVPVGWNEEKRRVEVGIMPTIEPTPTPTQVITPESSPENIGVYEDDKIKIEVLGFRFPTYEEFDFDGITRRVICVEIRAINKTDVFLPFEFEDFRGLYKLKAPPKVEQFQYVHNSIYSNGSDIFTPKPYNPKNTTDERRKSIMSFPFHMLAPNEERHGNVMFQTVLYGYEYVGVEYKGNKITFTP